VIRIERPDAIPEVLRSRGAAATAALINNRRNGATRLEFDSSIYGDPDLKKQLIQAQRGKCCFCESKVTHISFGHIEHFRPKAGVRQSPLCQRD
jgi:hypothetical protein